MPKLIYFLSFVFTIQLGGGITSQVDTVSLHQYAMDCCKYLGFIAHEEKAGAAFYELKEGDIITLTYPEEIRKYKVIDVWVSYALILDNANIPADVPTYRDREGIPINGYQLFDMTYGSADLTLQTCYNGMVGRLFVMAERITYEQKDR